MKTQPLAKELPRLTPTAIDALRGAADALPPGRAHVNAVDLVLAILGLNGAGARVVDVLAPGCIGAIEEVLGSVKNAVGRGALSFGEVDLPDGRTVTLDLTGREVLDELSRLAGRTADTKDLLLAEASRTRSVTVHALATLGVGGSPGSLAPQLRALAKRVGDDSRGGAALVVFRPSGSKPADEPEPDRTTWSGPVARGATRPTPIDRATAPRPADVVDPDEADGSVVQPTTPTSSPTSPAEGKATPPKLSHIGPVVDLLARARDLGDDAGSVYVNPEWVKRVLSVVERSPLTVLVGDSPESNDELAAALGAQLARDTAGVFGYASVVVLDPGYLATQPANALRDGLKAAKGGVLYLPNIPRYLDHNRSSGASIDLRRDLARGELRVLGTLDEREIGRLWPPEDPPPHELIYLDPAGVDETVGILKSRRTEIERQVSSPALQLSVTDEAIEAAARAADRYFREPPPPGGAIRLVLEAATAIKLRAASGMETLHDPRVAATPTIDADDVLLALERINGIKAQLDDQQRLLTIEDFLRKRVVGQEEAIASLADAVRRARAGLKDVNRPIGSFIFMGPSGVGKTELAKALAEFLFDDRDALHRLDMSEFHERHTIARLIGAPPGYVGFDEGGQLTEPIRRKPYQLVLFDEIEKAHPDVHGILLQIMDDGRLTDSRGRTVDFRNTVVIMTGNVGSEFFRVEHELGREKIVEAVREEMREAFRPEFLGRVDDILIFNSLGPDEMRLIVRIQARRLERKLGAQAMSIELSEALLEQLATAGYNPALGARPLRGEIRRLIERPLSRLIIDGTFASGDTVLADVDESGTVTFAKATPEPDQPAAGEPEEPSATEPASETDQPAGPATAEPAAAEPTAGEPATVPAAQSADEPTPDTDQPAEPTADEPEEPSATEPASE